VGSPAAVDEWTAWAITAIELPDESLLSRWADVLAEAAADATEWEPLSERIRAGSEGQSLDPNAVEEFLRAVGDTGQGVDLVRQLAELGDQLPGFYLSLRAQTEQPEQAAEEGEFDWLLPEHQHQLAGLWGDGWADYLRQQLDYRWGAGWQAHPAEHKTAWFQDVLAELTQPPESAPAAIDSALAEAVATVPGAAELSEQQLAEVMAEVQARLQATKENAS